MNVKTFIITVKWYSYKKTSIFNDFIYIEVKK